MEPVGCPLRQVSVPIRQFRPWVQQFRLWVQQFRPVSGSDSPVKHSIQQAKADRCAAGQFLKVPYPAAAGMWMISFFRPANFSKRRAAAVASPELLYVRALFRRENVWASALVHSDYFYIGLLVLPSFFVPDDIGRYFMADEIEM